MTFEDIQKIVLNTKEVNFLIENKCGGCQNPTMPINFFINAQDKNDYWAWIRCQKCSRKTIDFEDNSSYYKLTQQDLFTIKCLI